jgi:ribosome maturation protein SDO1
MVSVEKAVIARVSKGNEVFEVLVDPDRALQFRKGVDVSIENMLAVNEIFKDSKKGERASSSELEKHFGTTDTLKIASKIVKEGDIQLTTEQRRSLVEEKKKQIAEIISRQGVNPKTKLPHPQQRVLNAMEEAHINVDPFRSARDQVEDVLLKVQEIIPVSMERVEIVIKVPMQYAGKASSVIRNMVSIKKEEWTADAWIAVVEISAGMQADIYSKLNDITGGNVEVKTVNRS